MDVPRFLRESARFSESDLADVLAGKAVSKLLQSSDDRELVVFGIVRVDASRDRFVQALRDIEGFKKSSEVLLVGKIGNLPGLRDLQRLTLEPEDIEALKTCQPGKCEVKLPASAITRFGKEIDWTARDSGERANALFRRLLLEYLTQYLAKGNKALAEYSDRNAGARLADELESMLGQSTYLDSVAPDFRTYLTTFPAGRPPATENFVYWSKESFGLKPVISLTHVSIQQRTEGVQHIAVASSKQIYATHYFDGSLGLTFFFEQGAGGEMPGSYLAYLNRSRVDALRGTLGKLKRSIVATELKGGVERNLRIAKRKLESGSPQR